MSDVKSQIAGAMIQFGMRPGSPSVDDLLQEMRLIKAKSQDVLTDNEATLQTAELQENEVLHLVFAVNDDNTEYEPVEIISTDLQDA